MFEQNEKDQLMKKTNIPLYTINQQIYCIIFEDFTVVRGTLSRRLCDEDGNYTYIFKNDKFQVEYEEENIFKTFKEAKKYMEEVVQTTLDDVKKITQKDVRDI